MALPAVHVGVGMTFAFAIVFIRYIKQKFYLSHRLLTILPLIFLICAVWALVPSISSRLGLFPAINNLLHSPIGNIFFFHHFLATHESGGGVWGVSLVLAVFNGYILLCIQSILRMEKEIKYLEEG